MVIQPNIHNYANQKAFITTQIAIPVNYTLFSTVYRKVCVCVGGGGGGGGGKEGSGPTC